MNRRKGGEATQSPQANTFTIDTKGICFLCLRLKENFKVRSPTIATTTTHSFQKLCRFLNLDYQKVFNISSAMFSTKAMEEAELLVSLCNTCSSEANQFYQIYEEMEAIKIKVNQCVRNMYLLMVNADNNSSLVQQYRDRMITSNPLELVQAGIAENFRTELKDKCLMNDPQNSQWFLTRVKAKPVPKLLEMSPAVAPPASAMVSRTNKPGPLSRKRQFGKFSLPSGQPQAVPTTSSGIKVVECVDLDLEEDSGESNSPPELIISSVSGSDGSAYDSSLPSSSSSTALTTALQLPALAPTTSSFSGGRSTGGILDDTDSFLASLFAPPPATRTFKNGKETSAEIWFNAGDGRLQCKICGKLILMTSTDNLTNHERMHSGLKPIKCIYCPQRFRNNWTLRFHFVSNHKSELLSKFRFNSVSTENFKIIVEHVFRETCKKDQDNKNFSCPYCQKSLRQRYDMDAHLIQYHFDNLAKKLNETQIDPAALRFDTSPSVSAPPLPTLDPLLETSINYKNVCPSVTISYAQGTSKPEKPPQQVVINRPPLPLSSTSTSSPVSSTMPTPRGPSKTNFKCNICRRFFTSLNFLKKHKLSAHNIGNLNTSIPSEGLTISPVPSKRPYHSLPSTSSSSSTFSLPSPRPNHNPTTSISSTSTDASKEKKFRCAYCKLSFKFYSTHQIHQLNVHRFQVFSKYLEDKVTEEEIDIVMNSLLKEFDMKGSHCSCKYCERLFTPNEVELSLFRNHLLLSHLNELIEGLKKGVKENRERKLQEENPTLSQSEMIVPKEEEEEVIEILPD